MHGSSSIGPPTYGLQLSILALNDNELRLIQNILVGDENEVFGTIGDQPISRKDIRTLRGLTWLNDEVRRTRNEFVQRS